jgi:hypothetical protein
MPLSRRTLFKGLGAAALIVVAPKLITSVDPEYVQWVADGKPKSFLGTGPLENLAQRTSRMSAEWRTYLLSRTGVGCMVLYAEMLNIPKEMWQNLPADVYTEASRYRPVVKKPDGDWLEGVSLAGYLEIGKNSLPFAVTNLDPRTTFDIQYDANKEAFDKAVANANIQQTNNRKLWTPSKT